jgi:anti-sigma factor RsiW
MSRDARPGEIAVHEDLAALLPWYVNGTIGEPDRQRFDHHLKTCASCREELEIERRIHRRVAADPPVEYMPAASLKRLQARIDSLDGEAPPTDAPMVRRTRRPRRPQGWMAASLAVIAVASGWMAVDGWRMFRAPAAPANYYTVTTSAVHARDEVIRAVFSPTITLAELQAILAEAQLRIVAGPSEAGVYSLAANSSRPVSLSLALLRQHSTVRFAEITQPGSTQHSGP